MNLLFIHYHSFEFSAEAIYQCFFLHCSFVVLVVRSIQFMLFFVFTKQFLDILEAQMIRPNHDKQKVRLIFFGVRLTADKVRYCLFIDFRLK